jgi:intracellular sulfur oxidation DsrE/DsrF family protein
MIIKMISVPNIKKPLVWNFQNDGKCYAILKSGDRCNNPTKINQKTKKQNLWCDQHKPCSDQRRLMKESCRGSQTRCSDFQNINAIKGQKDVIQTCLRNRINMWNNCYHEDVQDIRHYQAITFLQDKVDECKNIIEDYNEMNPKEEKTKKEKSISQYQLDLLRLTAGAKEEKPSGLFTTSSTKKVTSSPKQNKKKQKKKNQSKTNLTKQEDDDVFATFLKIAEDERKAQEKETALVKEQKKLNSQITEYRNIKFSITNKIRDIENYGIQNEDSAKIVIKIGTEIIKAIDNFIKDPNEINYKLAYMLLKESAEPVKTIDKIINENFKYFELKARITYEIIKQLIFLDLFLYQIYYRVDELDIKEVEFLVENLENYRNLYKILKIRINQINFDHLSTQLNDIENDYNKVTDGLIQSQKTIKSTKTFQNIYDIKFHDKLKKLYPPDISQFQDDLGGYLNILKNYKI